MNRKLEHDSGLGRDSRREDDFTALASRSISHEAKNEGEENNPLQEPHDTEQEANYAKQPKQKRRSEIKDKISNKKHQLKSKTKPPGGFDRTPLPDAPPGYTVKFVFHRATNLPIADLHTGSCDPYIVATLTTPIPKRHKDDPDLAFRTNTLRKTKEPAWEEEWTVANIPPSGFTLKCRLYDEDYPDRNDRLGNVTIQVPKVDQDWEGYPAPGKEFLVKKRAGSKRAYLLQGCMSIMSTKIEMNAKLFISITVLGQSDPPHGQIYTLGPSKWIKHYSPVIGRLAGTKVNKDSEKDSKTSPAGARETKKYDFQANEMQLVGPVPPKMYHRYVEFRPWIGLMFSSRGIRGKILSAALHKQHKRIYNFNSSTENGKFEPCSSNASLQFLRMAHFDEGGRIFTYVLTLDGLLRFTETGSEFGIDLLSKHTMHSDVARYVACSGEFLIRRLAKPTGTESVEPDGGTHPVKDIPGGPPHEAPPPDPALYQLVIDNDSGTYRPDKSILRDLREFLERNFPSLGVVVLACDDSELERIKKAQLEAKKAEGHQVNMILNRSPSASSISSSDESVLDHMAAGGSRQQRSRREAAFDVLEHPKKLKEVLMSGSKE